MKTKIKQTVILFLFLVASSQLVATEFELDKNKSTLSWTGKKVTGKHFGTIDFNKGSLVVDDQKIVSGSFEVDMQTIVCEDLENENFNGKLVGHLKSDDFFSTDKYPTSLLRFTNVKHMEGNKYQFEADLTIKGQTHPVTFDAEVKFEKNDVSAKGTLKVDRTIYDIKYGSGKFFSNLGDNMIDDHFILDFNMTASVPEKSTMINN